MTNAANKVIISLDDTPYLSGWGNRIRYTINSDKVDSDLTHYPLPIFITNSDVFDEVGANSKKIAVTKSDGTTQLYVEIDYWDNGSDDATIWVSKSDWTILSSSDTDIYLYYDNNQDDNTDYVGNSNDPVSSNVWDDHYVAVHHLQDDNCYDSTTYSGHGSLVKNASIQSGKFGNGLNGDYYNSPYKGDGMEAPDGNHLDLTDTITTQGWIKLDATGIHHVVSAKQYDGSYTSQCCWQLVIKNDNEFRWAIGSRFDVSPSSPKATTGTWYFIIGTYSDTANQYRLWVDNSIIASSDATSGAIRTSSQKYGIGGRPYNGDLYYTSEGTEDEVRTSNIVRSNAWLKADYYSQSDALVTETTDNPIKSIIDVNVNIDNEFKSIVEGHILNSNREWKLWWGGEIAIFAGGNTPTDTIEYFKIGTLSNAVDFGNITSSDIRKNIGATSNGSLDRGLLCGGQGVSITDDMDYITISIKSNSTFYGNMAERRYYLAAISNGTNDKYFGMGGWLSTATDTIDTRTISTTGNASDFGNLNMPKWNSMACSNGTNERGISAGGKSADSVRLNIISYFDMSKASDNATDFGDLTNANSAGCATSNGTHETGLFAMGYYNLSGTTNAVEKITISTTGNATDVLNLTVARYGLAATSNKEKERAVFGGGNTGGGVIDYTNMVSLANCSDFGDLLESRTGLGACSNA